MRTINLAEGRRIYADMFLARLTYLGLMEGIPNDRINAHMISDIERSCKRTLHCERCGILPPTVTTFQHKDKIGRKLPACAIAGRFIAAGTVRDHSKDYSQLAILWFQETVDPLISPEALAAIEKLDWVEHAEDIYH
jgi:hypothetical protein